MHRVRGLELHELEVVLAGLFKLIALHVSMCEQLINFGEVRGVSGLLIQDQHRLQRLCVIFHITDN